MRCGVFREFWQVGTSFAFAEPDRALTGGVILNGLVEHEPAFAR
jgi:hypothetical protein